MFRRLPPPLTLEEVRRKTPRIDPLPDDPDRPLWSVMVPTHNRPDYLRKALASVLDQDPGPDRMQIRVLDNASDVGDIAGVVREVGGGRVEYFRHPANVVPEHFDHCIRQARGRWVHILHDDDAVLPGFYAAYEDVIRSDPDVVMVFGQTIIIDDKDRWVGLFGPPPPPGGGRVPEFLSTIAQHSHLAYASTVVRRTAYEQVGGFCQCFVSLSDWDMWLRVGQVGPVGIVPRPYALYRSHALNGTWRLRECGDAVREQYLFRTLNKLRCGSLADRVDGVPWRWFLSRQACYFAGLHGQEGSPRGRLANARWAWMLAPSFTTFRVVAKAWLRHQVACRPPFRH